MVAKLLTSFTGLNADEDGVSLGSSTTDKITVQNLNYGDNKGQNGLNIGIYDLGTAGVVAFASKSYDVCNLNSGSFTPSQDVKLIAEGTFNTGSDGNAVAISLNLNSKYTGDVKLHFSNAYINRITGTTFKDDVIYIERNTDYNSNGVDPNATLNFYHGGKDTIYFNGATTVLDIWGG